MKKSDNIHDSKGYLKVNRVSKSKESPKDSENFSPPINIPATPFRSCPETCEEMINTYGTYNIQATANTANDFPAIAQGTPPYMEDRPLEFFRDGDDTNPASDISDEHCL